MINASEFRVIEEGTTYALPVYEVVDGVGLVKTDEEQIITFVRGDKTDNGQVIPRVKGILHEGLIEAMLVDLNYKNKLVPGRENSLVITNLEQALLWQKRRAENRQKAGTQGTYQK